jgi:hypothetical protein
VLIGRGKPLKLRKFLRKNKDALSRSEIQTDPYVDLKKLVLAEGQQSVEQLVSHSKTKSFFLLKQPAEKIKLKILHLLIVRYYLF